MGDLLNYFIEVLEYIPTNLINIGVIGYLLWFGKAHTAEHETIITKIIDNEEAIDLRIARNDEDRKLMLKGLIANDNLPNFVRLDFYEEYKKMNGNSWVDNYVEENIKYTNKKYGRRYDDVEEYNDGKQLSGGAYRFQKSTNKNEGEPE